MATTLKNNCGVYKITSPTGRVYIGSSINIEKRLRGYKNLQCKAQKLLYRSLNKYGVESHKFETVLYCEPKDILMYERLVGQHYNCTTDGLNCKLPKKGEAKAEIRKETRLKMSESAKNKPPVEESTKKLQSKIHREIKSYKRFGDCKGSNNGNYDHKIYNFYNNITKQEIRCTQAELIETYKLTRSAVSSIISGKRNTHKGWQFIGEFTSPFGYEE